MKILAKTDSGFIVAITDLEMANVQGFPDPAASGYLSPKEGDTVNVPGLLQDAGKLRQAFSRLRNAVDQTAAELNRIGF